MHKLRLVCASTIVAASNSVLAQGLPTVSETVSVRWSDANVPVESRGLSSMRLPPLTRAAAGPAFSVVELPPEPGPGLRRRPHHALTFQAPAVSRMLDRMGLDGASCLTRLRLPTRLRQVVGTGSDLDVKAQIGISCRY